VIFRQGIDFQQKRLTAEMENSKNEAEESESEESESDEVQVVQDGIDDIEITGTTPTLKQPQITAFL